DVGHGTRNLIPEEIAAQHDALIPAGHDRAALRAGQALGAEVRIELREHIARTKAAIEFVQSWRAKRAVPRCGKRHITGELVQKGQAWAEEGLTAIGK